MCGGSPHSALIVLSNKNVQDEGKEYISAHPEGRSS